ncbi:MAG: CRISPR-associated endonuclease Cas2 [Candidatus Heimdallarchaeota archaeon]
MFIIIVYDVATERVVRVNQYLKRYLNWIQNSVFSGEVTKSQLHFIKKRLEEIIEKKEDSVIIYEISNKKWLKEQIIGVEKGKKDRFL